MRLKFANVSQNKVQQYITIKSWRKSENDRE